MKTAFCAIVLAVFSFGLIGCGGEEETAVETPDVSEALKEAVEALPEVEAPASVPASIPASVPAVEASAEATLVALGKDLVAERDCVNCHSSDGAELQGPTFKGMYSADQAVETAGFPVCCPGSLGDEEIVAVIAYIKSVQ